MTCSAAYLGTVAVETEATCTDSQEIVLAAGIVYAVADP